jgi:2'-5' RNA ligase
LRPDAATRAALATLAQYHARHNGRAVTPENLHLTLVFVGGVTAAQHACMEAAAATVIAPPFAFTLDSLGFWPRPRVLWAGADAAPSALTDLVTRLSAALVPCGYQPEVRPFKAHVTLARKAQRLPTTQQMPPLVWQADDFCLVESVTGEQGSEYRVIARWPLLFRS